MASRLRRWRKVRKALVAGVVAGGGVVGTQLQNGIMPWSLATIVPAVLAGVTAGAGTYQVPNAE